MVTVEPVVSRQDPAVIDRREYSVALEQSRPSTAERIAQYAVALGIVLVLAAWIGRRRARGDDK